MSKFTIYQVFPRYFGNEKTANKQHGTIEENGCGKFNSFSRKALQEIKSLGITHIWYTGVIEHATQTDYSAFGIRKDHAAIVKGRAGSPYAIKDYYDVDPDLADEVDSRMAEFESLVRRTHEEGMKVIIDFVPNHVAREYCSDAKPAGVTDLGETDHPEWAFSPLNNFYYIYNQQFSPTFDVAGYNEFPAKATGNDQFTASPSHYDWYETVKLNYGVNYVEGGQKQFSPIPDTWLKMRDILLFWASKEVDGFRCDMAEMVPVEFWGWVIPEIKLRFPEVLFIAEVYKPAEYHNYLWNGKFDYLYDKVGLYETLRNILVYNAPACEITGCWQSLGGIEDRMLNFLENHDEQRIASTFFCGNGMQACAAMIVAATLTRCPVMIYSGQELNEPGMDSEGFSGLDGRSTIFDYWGLKSLQTWSNGGAFDGVKLTGEQRDLREFYRMLLNISLNEKAISQGVMYDLEYANLSNPAFDSHKQYVFCRKHLDDFLLIVVNFADKPLETSVCFPCEALSYLEAEEDCIYDIQNLLAPEEVYSPQKLSSKSLFRVGKLPAWKGVILKLRRI